MKILYDIEQCENILIRLNELMDCLGRCDKQLYDELATIESSWEGDASLMFLVNAYQNEEYYLKNLILFKDALSTLTGIHNLYNEAKSLVDKKFKEIRYG